MGNSILREQELETRTRDKDNSRLRYDVPPDDAQIRSVQIHIKGLLDQTVIGSSTQEDSPENFIKNIRWIFQGKPISEARGDMLRDLHVKFYHREPSRIVPGFTVAVHPFEINLVFPFANIGGWKHADTFFDARGLTKNLQLEIELGTADDLTTGGVKTFTCDITPIIEYEEDLVRFPDAPRNIGTRLKEFQQDITGAKTNDGMRIDIDQGRYNLLIIRIRKDGVRDDSILTHFRLEGSIPVKGFKELIMKPYSAHTARQKDIVGSIDPIRPGTLYLIPNPDGNIREDYPFQNSTNAAFKATVGTPSGVSDITILAREILDPVADLGKSGRRRFNA